MKKNSIQEEILEMSTYSIPMSVQSEKSVACFVLLSILRNFDVVENTHARKTTNKFNLMLIFVTTHHRRCISFLYSLFQNLFFHSLYRIFAE